MAKLINKETLKLDMGDIRHLVEDALYGIMNRGKSLPPKDSLKFLNEKVRKEVMSWPEDAVNKAFRDYRADMFIENFACLPMLLLNEGLIATYPLKDTIRYIKNILDIPDEAIYVVYSKDDKETVKGINITFANIGDNVNQAVRAMNLCGYFPSHPKPLSSLPRNTWVRIKFEPKIQSVDNSVIGQEKILYHFTTAPLIEKIKKNGLVPTTKNNFLSFPDRIYLMKGSATPEKLYELLEMLCAARFIGRPIENRYEKLNVGIVVIDVSKLDKNIRFFEDYNYKGGVFTSDNIPPTAIKETTIKPIIIDMAKYFPDKF